MGTDARREYGNAIYSKAEEREEEKRNVSYKQGKKWAGRNPFPEQRLPCRDRTAGPRKGGSPVHKNQRKSAIRIAVACLLD